MTNLIGQLPEFDSTKDSITTSSKIVYRGQWHRRRSESACATLSLIGGKTYDLLRNLLSPTDPKEKTFDELIETLSGHFEPKPIVIAELLQETPSSRHSVFGGAKEARETLRVQDVLGGSATGPFRVRSSCQTHPESPADREEPDADKGVRGSSKHGSGCKRSD